MSRKIFLAGGTTHVPYNAWLAFQLFFCPLSGTSSGHSKLTSLLYKSFILNTVRYTFAKTPTACLVTMMVQFGYRTEIQTFSFDSASLQILARAYIAPLRRLRTYFVSTLQGVPLRQTSIPSFALIFTVFRQSREDR